jgi:uncharacterized hydrophobic protein (TIGR00271 family)
MSICNVAFFYGTVEETYLEKIKDLLKEARVSFFPLSELVSISHAHFSHYLVSGTLEEIKEVLQFVLMEHKSVGIVPLPEQKELTRTFALSSKLEVLLQQAMTPAEEKIDVLFSNGELVLQEVVVGDVPPLDSYDTVLKGKGLFSRIKLLFHTLKKVKRLHHRRFTLTDADEKKLKFSAVGLVGVEYDNATFASKLIAGQINATDGKLSLLIVAPTSILQYMGYLFTALISRWTPKQLPRSLGYIRSSYLKIESHVPLEVLIDAAHQQETPVELRVDKTALALSVGETFWERQSEEVKGKNSTKTDHLPSDEESASYLAKAIPLFAHASQEQYASLFTSLREEAKLTSVFMTLLIFATMIATFGLFINSASVIIGAMLLAPLMQPIVSLSMGVLRQDSVLEVTAARTIAIGVGSVLLTAAVIAWFTPMEKLTTEMAGRLFPTILDLFVAIASGAAAAYAKSNEKIAGSLAGVAIAVALVPPIAVAGIGLGWGEWHMFTSALLLFLTNLVGIVLAAALMFVLLGYSPLKIARRGVIIWLMIALLISVPLYSSFEKMKTNTAIQKQLTNIHFQLSKHEVTLTHIELLQHSQTLELRCEVIANGFLTQEEKQMLKKVIEETVGREVEVIVTFRYKL